MNYSLTESYHKMTGGASLNWKTSTEIGQACVNKHALLSFPHSFCYLLETLGQIYWIWADMRVWLQKSSAAAWFRDHLSTDTFSHPLFSGISDQSWRFCSFAGWAEEDIWTKLKMKLKGPNNRQSKYRHCLVSWKLHSCPEC